MSTHTDIADAVVAAINDAELGEFTAERKMRAQVTREQAEAGIIVQVIPRRVVSSHVDRRHTQELYTIDVGIVRAVDPDDLTACGVLDDLAESIKHLLELQRLDGYPAAVWQETEYLIGAGYSEEHLDTQRTFLAVLRLVFLVSN